MLLFLPHFHPAGKSLLEDSKTEMQFARHIGVPDHGVGVTCETLYDQGTRPCFPIHERPVYRFPEVSLTDSFGLGIDAPTSS